MILSIDPGQQGLSWMLGGEALISGAVIPLKGKTLYEQAAYALAHMPDPRIVSAIACERMWAYPQPASAKFFAEMRAILDLQAIGGLVSGHYRCPVTYYTPREWMGGSIPEHVTRARVEMFLRPEEAENFARVLIETRKDLRHNAYDACGVWLKHQGRWR